MNTTPNPLAAWPGPSGIITLLTDFGHRDPYVGVMKGVVLSHFRNALFVDLAHGLDAHDVRQAAFWLEVSFRWFPRGTVHLGVVDPGVGGTRLPLVVRAFDHLFVGPDNGIFGWTRADPKAEIRRIDLDQTGLGVPSATFHGRDVFAPIAARLAAGTFAFDAIGPSVAALVELGPPAVIEGEGTLEGSVVLTDHFGNLITNIDQTRLAGLERVRVRVGERECELCPGYFSVPSGELLALIGSSGVLEVSIREGNAARELDARPGTPVIVSGTRRASAKP